jgi:hypothetical protein
MSREINSYDDLVSLVLEMLVKKGIGEGSKEHLIGYVQKLQGNIQAVKFLCQLFRDEKLALVVRDLFMKETFNPHKNFSDSVLRIWESGIDEKYFANCFFLLWTAFGIMPPNRVSFSGHEMWRFESGKFRENLFNLNKINTKLSQEEPGALFLEWRNGKHVLFCDILDDEVMVRTFDETKNFVESGEVILKKNPVSQDVTNIFQNVEMGLTYLYEVLTKKFTVPRSYDIEYFKDIFRLIEPK